MDAKTRKPPTTLNTERRVLEFINQVRRPEDFCWLKKYDAKRALKLLHDRDAFSPFGFYRIDDLLEILPSDWLDDLFERFSNRTYGKWETLYAAPQDDPPVHAALLKTGHVLFIPHGHFAEMPVSYLWDPSKGNAEEAFYYPDNQPDDNLYCAGHAFMSDGRLLLCGGGGAGPNNVDRAWIFDPEGGTNGTWTRTANDMNVARWYPTVVTLGGGKLMVVGGRPDTDSVEIFDEASETFSLISIDSADLHDFPQTYPGLHLLPGGEIFYTRTGFASATPSVPPTAYTDTTTQSYYFQHNGSTGAWIPLSDTMSQPNREKGMSVPLFEHTTGNSYVSKVLVAGGYGSDQAELLDTAGLTPTWQPPTTIPGGGRSNLNLVLLPTNKVFLCGGASTSNSAVLSSAMYDPVSNTWQSMDSLESRRAYHSVAILLPSGQVMASGDVNNLFEVYDPPYMFMGSRPVIDDVPSTIHHGNIFHVQTAQAANIEQVTLVRPMAVTHQTDTEQRVIELDFHQEGNELAVTAPDGGHPHAIAPRGYYMLFIIDDQGVPSEGSFVLLH